MDEGKIEKVEVGDERKGKLSMFEVYLLSHVNQCRFANRQSPSIGKSRKVNLLKESMKKPQPPRFRIRVWRMKNLV